MALARGRATKIRTAARVAGFNGWVIGSLAVCSAPFALFGLTNLLVVLGLAVVAYNEFQGRKRLLEFDPSAAALLGWNQVGLLALIVVYCLWMLYLSLTNTGTFASQLKVLPGAADSLGSVDVEHLYKILVFAIYGLVIVLSAIFQGLNALYYFTRHRYVEAYLQETPRWVVDLQRMTTPG